MPAVRAALNMTGLQSRHKLIAVLSDYLGKEGSAISCGLQSPSKTFIMKRTFVPAQSDGANVKKVVITPRLRFCRHEVLLDIFANLATRIVSMFADMSQT